MYICKLDNQTIHLQSRPRIEDGSKEKVSLDLLSLSSSVAWGFV